VGHLRSVLYPNDHVASNFWAQPRMAPCMDGSCAIFTTNFGLPENYQVAKVTFPNSGGALASNQFDAMHAVTPSITGTGVTFNYSTPDTGIAIVEIGQSQRLTDGTVPIDPSGACLTASWTLLSLASQSVFTCAANHNWTRSTPDPTYQATINSSGSNPRSDTFAGLQTNIPYYYRITANNKTLAYGTINPGQ